METKLKIIEILQVALVLFPLPVICSCVCIVFQLLKRILSCVQRVTLTLIVVYSRCSTGLSHIKSSVNLQTRIWWEHFWQGWWRYFEPQRQFRVL